MKRDALPVGHGRAPAAGPSAHVAVVGSGIAGLATAWLLSQRYRVTLLEAAPRAGGHSHSVEVSLEGSRFRVDAGFLVFNRTTYPELTAMFEHLGVACANSDMSLGVSLDEGRLEWAGSSLNTVFAQRSNLLSADFYALLRDIARFNREATALVAQGMPAASLTLGEFVEQQGYGRWFRDAYLMPMAAAIWSCPKVTMAHYPLATFLRFCHNHGLLRIGNRPQWLTVKGSSEQYVRRIVGQLDDLRCSTPVRQIRRREGAVEIDTARGSLRVDAVVLACHSDQALRLLDDADARERSVLGAIRYQDNEAVLHQDESLLPVRRRVWSAWNYLGRSTPHDDVRPVQVSYLINRLQPLPCRAPVVVTLNPARPPLPSKVIERFEFAHPVFDQAAIDAQEALPTIQGARRTWFAGAWTRYGFHEDGLQSAIYVARALGCEPPWHVPVSDRHADTSLVGK